MNISETNSKEISFLIKIQNETKIFNNIGFIIEKMHSEGNFKTIRNIFKTIFSQEVLYTVKGKNKKNY